VSEDRRGLYETLVTEALRASLRDLDARLAPDETDLRAAEAADRTALHLSQIVRRAVAALPDDQTVAGGVALSQKLVQVVSEMVSEADVANDAPVDPGRVLRAIRARRPDGSEEEIAGPMIPLLDTTLLTNAPGEPRVGAQLQTEIQSADRIDVVMAFIRQSGIGPLLDALRIHCEHGRPLRVLTTTYTGSTEQRALDALRRIGAQIRVSYDTTTTRLHAKAWLFHRTSGYSTAYIGSSNLTHSAQVTGLEWNVRVSGARNPDVLEKMTAVFESYWNGGDFVPYDAQQFRDSVDDGAPAGARIMLSPVEVRPEPFQERLLEQIALSRQHGHHRNLLVSATGTGKTVMAAIDYARLRDVLPRARLLFVAHREEILEQSRATFRHCLRDAAFGELWVGRQRPRRFEHVFASIQSLHATGLVDLEPTHFDVVIVDEFHHAAAGSYRELLRHVRPLELLGLTATPERADGLSVLDYFDGRIAAEMRLWDAIDQHRLVPFAYYAIHDGLDLRDVPFRRGTGYDVDALTNLLTANDAWANRVLKELVQHAESAGTMRVLGFCVSIQHARFMARKFNEANVAAVAIWSDTEDDERKRALADLQAGRIRAVFSVDLFNEGVDVPTVDTLLLLRPTESPTLFLQQLGRGLRRAKGKTICTVLDFVGNHHKDFRFDRRLRALLPGSRKEIEAHVEAGFPFLPAGCHMQLDRVASEIVLRSIREAIPSRWAGKVDELRSIARGSVDVTLASYLDHSGLDLDDVYAGNRSWSELREDAGITVAPSGPHEEALRRACGRLLHIDDAARIETYRRLLAREAAPDPGQLPVRDQRLLRMLVGSVVDQVVSKTTPLADGAALLWSHPQVRTEILGLLEVLESRIQHVQHALSTHADVPLLVHARYTRIEILSAFGVGKAAKIAAWQTGVRRLDDSNVDLLAFTLDKTSGQFSPTTRYRDYAISRNLIHWESQSVVRADSDTGRRYREQLVRGGTVLLFARLRTDDRAFWFLGPATYQSHQSELPMAITWKLEHALPGDLFATFAAAV
jgi:superfamily II DNA or RNA helicase/HKD family nuclease